MTQKLLLAEALDVLRQSEIREYDLDKTRERIGSNNRYKGELHRLLQGYHAVYAQFLSGLEILNYIRHEALDDRNPQTAQYSKNLAEFCSGKMTAYMDRCENLIRKIDDVLLPLDQIDLITKEGYVPEETIYMQDGQSYPLTRKERFIAKEFTLRDGTYVLTVKNKDSYSIAAPAVDVVVTVTPQRGSGTEPLRVAKSIPTETGWRKVIGVVATTTLQVEVHAAGIRDAHVDVLLQKWRPAGDVKSQFSSDFATVSKRNSANHEFTYTPPGAHLMGGQLRSQFESSNYGTDNYTGGVPGATPPAHGPGYTSGLPSLPDDDLAALANYNVPQDQLPGRGSGGAVAPAAAMLGQSGPAPPPPPPLEDAWAALQRLSVPHSGSHGTPHTGRVPDPVEVNPAGLTCKERLFKVRDMLSAWPSNASMANLPADKQRIVQSVYALPLPRELD